MKVVTFLAALQTTQSKTGNLNEVVSWGHPVAGSGLKGVNKVLCNPTTCAGVTESGTVVSWGYETTGGDSFGVDFTSGGGVKDLFATEMSFAALKHDGSVVSWGLQYSASVQFPGASNVKEISTTNSAFAALQADGSVVTWGIASNGGDSRTVNFRSGGGVKAIFATSQAFAALKQDGSVVTWGKASSGGSSTSVNFSFGGGVQTVLANDGAFTAIKQDGSMVSWGNVGQVKEADLGSGGGIKSVVTNEGAFAALKHDGSVVSWGFLHFGGNSLGIDFSSGGGVQSIFSLKRGFAAVKEDGSIVSWYPTVHLPPGKPVQSMCGTNPEKSPPEYVALRTDGSVIVWGPGGINLAWSSKRNVKMIACTDSTFILLMKNGDVDTLEGVIARGTFIESTYFSPVAPFDFSSGGAVKAIFSFQSSIVAIRNDGSVFTFGPDYEGDIYYDGGTSAVDLNSGGGIRTVASSSMAFASIQMDGSLRSWGSVYTGYSTTDWDADVPFVLFPNPRGRFKTIAATEEAFAALKEDGTIVTWGSEIFGGNSKTVESLNEVSQLFSTRRTFFAVKRDKSIVAWPESDSAQQLVELISGKPGVETIVGVQQYEEVFAALKKDGSVVTSGEINSGHLYLSLQDDSDQYSSDGYLNELEEGVTALFSNREAFAALKKDGSVVTWGSSDSGGDSSAIDFLSGGGATTVIATSRAFAALKRDGSVVTWGDIESGADSQGVDFRTGGGVKLVRSTQGAFAALKRDGSVVTWGDANLGGNSETVAPLLQRGVTMLFGTGGAFAALKKDSSVVTWGSWRHGGNSALVDFLSIKTSQIFSNTRSFVAVGRRMSPPVTPRPTFAPTSNPTAFPTESPTHFSSCHGVNVLLSVDTSASMSSKELHNQKIVLRHVLDLLPVGPNGVGVSLTSFGLNLVDKIPVTSILSSSETGGRNAAYVKEAVAQTLEPSANRARFTNFLPIFDAHHGRALVEVSERPVILIVSDGEPFVPQLHGSQKATRQACRAARKFKEEFPRVEILCFQSDSKSKASRFFKCACDTIWLANARRTESFDAELVALEIFQNRICTPNVKQPNPCSVVNMDISISHEKRRLKCLEVERDSKGVPVNSNLLTLKARRQCTWKNRECTVLRKFASLYT